MINDLALILVVAAATTLIFKRLRQPLVLGYILAGFLTGPHMSYMPTVTDMASIHTWSDIGVIFIMFSLGLEFSFKKIVKMGAAPVVAAVTVIFCMMTVGTLVGRAFGWSSMNSLFVGGMLAMSSTTIIYKALDELGMRQQKFASVVLSVLVLEDILGILLMVVLSALAASSHLEGGALVGSFLKLGFFLVLWFVVGIFVVPQVLRRNSKWIGSETLLVVAAGLCFALVALAEKSGYSSALGAFLMGSILAETVEAENIEKVIGPVKDLFGAIFFVSVGMLVDPAILVAYWKPVLVLTLAILLGQSILGSFSFLLSGQPLKTAMQCGFTMAQIGEFAFIIAALGVKLGVTSDFLYPVVVAVSIITTFTTPYMMRLAQPAYNVVERLLPGGLARRLERRGKPYNAAPQAICPWKTMMRDLLVTTAAYLVLTWAAIGMGLSVLLPALRGLLGHWAGNALTGLIIIALISLFLRPIVTRKFHSPEVKSWKRRGDRRSLGLFYLLLIPRFALAAGAIYYVLDYLSPLRWYWHILAACIILLSFCIEGKRWRNPLSKRVKYYSVRMERTFMQNLRSREVRAQAKRPGYERTLRRHDIHLAQIALPEDSAWGGHTLAQLELGRKTGVMVAAIVRGGNRLNIPDGHTMLYPGDRIEALGDDDSLHALSDRLKTEVLQLAPNDRRHRLIIEHFRVGKTSPFAGVYLSDSGIRSRYQCMVVGFESRDDDSGSIEMAQADRQIQPGETIWVVGEVDAVRRLLVRNREQAPTMPLPKNNVAT